MAGASLLSRIRILEREREGDTRVLGTIGGFELKAAGQRLWAGRGFHQQEAYQQSLWLGRTGYEQEVKVEEELTAMGLINRLEYQLDRFEVDLAGHRRAVEESAARVASFQQRLGQAFAYEADLDAKEAELAGIEASLKGTGTAEEGAAQGLSDTAQEAA